MEAILLSEVKEGQILGQTLYSEDGQVLLQKGASLSNYIIKKLQSTGYSRIYVWKDGLDYVMEDVVRPEIRQRTINDLRKFVMSTTGTGNHQLGNRKQNNIKHMQENVNILKVGVTTIVEELFLKKDIVVELLDLKNVNNAIYQHSVNVMIHSVIIGTSIGLNKVELNKLALAAVFHDIGLVFMPQDIINKNEKLTLEEYKIIKEHSKKGFEFLRDYFNLEPTIRIGVLEHHENYDGSGYPNKKKGEDIHLYSRIINIANKYDSLTSDRIYRKGIPVSEALEYIMGGGGTHFDPKLTHSFIKHINPYPINTLVKLDDGSVAVVYKVNHNFFTRPVISIITGKNKGDKVDLLEAKNIVIKTAM